MVHICQLVDYVFYYTFEIACIAVYVNLFRFVKFKVLRDNAAIYVRRWPVNIIAILFIVLADFYSENQKWTKSLQ